MVWKRSGGMPTVLEVMTVVLLGPAAASLPSTLTPSQLMVRNPTFCGAGVAPLLTPPRAFLKFWKAVAYQFRISGP